MMKLVLTKLGLELRRNIPLLLFCAVCWYFLSSVIMMAVFTQRVWEMPEVQHIYQSDSPELIQNFITGLLTQEYSAFACGLSALTLLLIGLVSARLPLRLPRALYACAAGEKEKLRFLKLYLTGKLIFMLLLLILSSLYWKTLFLSASAPAFAIQISLTVFLFLAFSLNTDPGNRREAKKKCPDMVTERSSETFVSVYWSALLILENTLFYSLVYAGTEWTWPLAALWIPILLVNIYLALKHTSPVLRHVLRYEKIYFPIQNETERKDIEHIY